MNNFINVRIQSTNNLKIKDRLKHNYRVITSLSCDKDIKNVGVNMDGKHGFFDSKSTYKVFSRLYNKDREKHNKIYKKHNKRNLRESFSSWGEGVITFSERINHDLGVKYTQKELIKIRTEYLKDFEKRLKTKVKGIVLHLDEKTPHFHFFYENFDEKGKSITWINRDRDSLSNLQDLRYRNFGKLGMDRGIKKDRDSLGKYDYTSRKRYHTQEHIKIKEEISNLKKLQDEIKSSIKELKEDRRDIQIDLNLTIDTKKRLYQEITIKQDRLRDINKLIKKYKLYKKNNVDKEITQQLKKDLDKKIKETDLNFDMF